MEYRRLGKAGLKLSILSFGSWVTFANQLDESDAPECMALAYEKGVNFFDNAEVYAAGQSEKLMGSVLKKMAWGRDTYCVSSKVFWGGEKPTQRGLCKKHIVDACHAAMKRLQVDYLDLYFCHRPDPETPIDETVRTMHELVLQGKILYWGTSEWSADQIAQAHEIAKENYLTAPAMEQPEYNLLHRNRVEVEYAPLYQKYGMGTTIWSPLASGVLTGKYLKGVPAGSRMALPGYEWLKAKYDTPEGRAKLEKTSQLGALAQELGVSLALLSIAWCAKNPQVSTVILGASRKSQLEENLKAIEVLPKLTDAVMQRIDAIVGKD